MTANSTTALLGQISSLGSVGGGLGGLKDPTLIYVGMLSSNSVARELITRFDLATVYGTRRFSQTEDALRKRTKIVSGKDSIVSVAVEDHDPQRAANLANGYLTALSNISDRIAITDASQKRRFFEQQLEHEKDSLANAEGQLALSQQQTGLIQPGAQAQMEILTIAQTQADISSREIQLASMNQAATDQNPDVIRLRTEILGLKAQLNRLENASGQTRPGNIQVPTSKVPEVALIYARKAREVKYHEALYELLLRQYEAAKLDESKSAPLMQVVDYASTPDTKSGPKRTLLTLFAAFIGVVVGMAWSSIKFFQNKKAQ
jgi:uncharacterized protein involved in exopolysaccharide biosynthesis